MVTSITHATEVTNSVKISRAAASSLATGMVAGASRRRSTAENPSRSGTPDAFEGWPKTGTSSSGSKRRQPGGGIAVEGETALKKRKSSEGGRVQGTRSSPAGPPLFSGLSW